MRRIEQLMVQLNIMVDECTANYIPETKRDIVTLVDAP